MAEPAEDAADDQEQDPVVKKKLQLSESKAESSELRNWVPNPNEFWCRTTSSAATSYHRTETTRSLVGRPRFIALK